MRTTTRVGVTLLSPLRDQERLMVHLASWDWPFAEFGPVELRIGEHRIHMRHEASGNIHGAPAARLAPCDGEYGTIDEIMELVFAHDLSQISLEFTPDRHTSSARHRA